MNTPSIKTLYQSLDEFEKSLLQEQREIFEQQQSIRFLNLEAYLSHLATKVINRKIQGEFVPRSMEEARAGYYLQ